MIAFHDAVRTVRFALDEVRAFGDPSRLFANVNSPDELAWAESIALDTVEVRNV